VVSEFFEQRVWSAFSGTRGLAASIHPANGFLAHEFLAKLTLGINPGEQPRWG
jgi:hypothetical protein